MITYKVAENIVEEPLWRGWITKTETDEFNSTIAAIVDKTMSHIRLCAYGPRELQAIGTLACNLVVMALIEAGNNAKNRPIQWGDMIGDVAGALWAAFEVEIQEAAKRHEGSEGWWPSTD